MKIDRAGFFPSARATVFHGILEQSQVNGLNSLLDAFEAAGITDARYIAYMLATAFHETAATMQPIEEYGHGRGHSYGVPTGMWYQVYDGRGDVQLTWIYNYAKATTELQKRGVLKPDESMIETPELALRPDVAAAVMIYGMQEGWFTGRKLADYFNANITDFISARRIINGMDCAALIGSYARNFLASIGEMK